MQPALLGGTGECGRRPALEELAEPLEHPITWKRKRVRGLHPFSGPPDSILFQLISRGEWALCRFRNADLGKRRGGHSSPLGGDKAKRYASERARIKFARANKSAGHSRSSSVIGASATDFQVDAMVGVCESMMLAASVVAPNPICSRRVLTPLSEERCQTSPLRYVLDMVVGPTPLMTPHSDSLLNRGTRSSNSIHSVPFRTSDKTPRRPFYSKQ